MKHSIYFSARYIKSKMPNMKNYVLLLYRWAESPMST